MKPTEIISRLLSNTQDFDVLKELVAEDATYVSCNYHNPELTSVEPCAGTHKNAGPAAIYETFVTVGKFWEILEFDLYAIFSGTESIETGKHGLEGKAGTNVAVFGKFKYRSRTLGRITDTPFCVWAKVEEQRQTVTYIQFMEDTLDTAQSFRKSGKMVYASNPAGGEIVISGDN